MLLSLFIVYSHACFCVKIRSISFFDIEKHETANSRWSRACTRAVGLVKVLQHSLEAVIYRETNLSFSFLLILLFWIEPNLILDYALFCNILTLDIGMDTTCIFTTSCSSVRVETLTSTGNCFSLTPFSHLCKNVWAESWNINLDVHLIEMLQVWYWQGKISNNVDNL